MCLTEILEEDRSAEFVVDSCGTEWVYGWKNLIAKTQLPRFHYLTPIMNDKVDIRRPHKAKGPIEVNDCYKPWCATDCPLTEYSRGVIHFNLKEVDPVFIIRGEQPWTSVHKWRVRTKLEDLVAIGTEDDACTLELEYFWKDADAFLRNH